MRQLAIVLTLLGFASPAFSQTTTPPALIKMIRTGWGGDAFAVVLLNQAILNPASCPPATADGYVADNTQPGYNTYLQAALAAYIAKRPVTVIIDNKPGSCSGVRPKLIGINIQ